MRLVISLIILLSISSITACTYAVEETLLPSDHCNLEAVSYTSNIVPILQNNCFQCHNNSTNPLSGGIGFETYADIKPYADSGTLQCAINHNIGCSPMPKNGPKLSDCTISQIENWITDGSNEN
ncbi:MAG: hypothetical protein ACI8ZO_000457 [Flavobacteriales bacterium]|jgi:hypothetical protein